MIFAQEAKSAWVDEDRGGLQMAPKRAAPEAPVSSAASAVEAAKRQRLIRPIG